MFWAPLEGALKHLDVGEPLFRRGDPLLEGGDPVTEVRGDLGGSLPRNSLPIIFHEP